MNGNRQDENILDILTGRNGQTSARIEEMDPADVERSIAQTLNRAVANNLTTEDAFLISAVSHHVDGGLFQEIARRRGGQWSAVAALADRVVQFEGLAKVYIEIAIQALNMQIALALKSKSSLDRLRLISMACEQMDPESRDIMAEGLAMSREFVLRVWRKAPDDFLNDAGRRMGGGYV